VLKVLKEGEISWSISLHPGDKSEERVAVVFLPACEEGIRRIPLKRKRRSTLFL